MLPLIVGLVATGVKSAAEMMGGSQAQRDAEAQARASDANYLLAQKQAYEALATGNRQALGAYGGGQSTIQSIETSAAGSGVSNQSSAVQGGVDTSLYLSDLDAKTARRNARLQFNNYMTQAQNYKNQAAAQRAAGRAARVEAMFSGGASLATSGLGLWNDYKRLGYSTQKDNSGLVPTTYGQMPDNTSGGGGIRKML